MAEIAQTHVMIGSAGIPRSKPFFWRGGPENLVRHPREHTACCFPALEPGPNIPPHWFDAGMGWVTHFFYDVDPFDIETQKKGVHRCQVILPNGQRCDHEIQGQTCCDCGPGCCWYPKGNAPFEMASHLSTSHGIVKTVQFKREWASGLCECGGCLDVWCCAPCQGSRQMSAIKGHADRFDLFWCLVFTYCGCEHMNCGDRDCWWYYPPHWLVALKTRYHVIRLNEIDEGMCCMWIKMACCAPCSVAQTYRELTAAGVWPGGYCNAAPGGGQVAIAPPPAMPPMAAGAAIPIQQGQPQPKNAW